MSRDHRFARRRMSDAVDGDLSPRQRARFVHHVDECPECGPMLRGLIRVRGVLRTFGTGSPPDADDSIAPRVIDRLRRDAGTNGKASRRR